MPHFSSLWLISLFLPPFTFSCLIFPPRAFSFAFFLILPHFTPPTSFFSLPPHFPYSCHLLPPYFTCFSLISILIVPLLALFSLPLPPHAPPLSLNSSHASSFLLVSTFPSSSCLLIPHLSPRHPYFASFYLLFPPSIFSFCLVLPPLTSSLCLIFSSSPEFYFLLPHFNTPPPPHLLSCLLGP